MRPVAASVFLLALWTGSCVTWAPEMIGMDDSYSRGRSGRIVSPDFTYEGEVSHIGETLEVDIVDHFMVFKKRNR